MPEKNSFRYEIRPADDFVDVELHGTLDGPTAARMFADVEKVVATSPRVRGVLYDARDLDEFSTDVITEARAMTARIAQRVARFAVISDRSTDRFAITAIRLAARQQIQAFGGREQAVAWLTARQ
jgi:hypothetical protein